MANVHYDGYYLLIYILKKYLYLPLLLPLMKYDYYHNYLVFIVFSEKYFSLEIINDVEYLIFNKDFKHPSLEYEMFFNE
jgi:hypothetical protein